MSAYQCFLVLETMGLLLSPAHLHSQHNSPQSAFHTDRRQNQRGQELLRWSSVKVVLQNLWCTQGRWVGTPIWVTKVLVRHFQTLGCGPIALSPLRLKRGRIGHVNTLSSTNAQIWTPQRTTSYPANYIWESPSPLQGVYTCIAEDLSNMDSSHDTGETNSWNKFVRHIYEKSNLFTPFGSKVWQEKISLATRNRHSKTQHKSLRRMYDRKDQMWHPETQPLKVYPKTCQVYLQGGRHSQNV